METSILNSVKKALGLDPDDDSFDDELVLHINSVFAELTQIGFDTTFQITGSDEVWDDIPDMNDDLAFVKSYIPLKVKYVWDPPSGSAMQSLENTIHMLEFRINVQKENENA